MTTYARCWWLVVVLVGTLGAAEALLTVPLFAVGAAAVASASLAALTCLVVFSHRDATSQPARPVRPVLVVAGWGALVGGILTGLAVMLDGGAAGLLLLFTCTHPRVLHAAAGAVRRRFGRGTDVAAPGGDHRPGPAAARRPAPVHVAWASTRPRDWATKTIPRTPPPPADWPDAAGMQLLTMSQLCWGWRTSFAALERAQGDQHRRGVLVAVRQHYLDEIARRDPGGLSRWLYSGARPASDPSRYLRERQPRAAAAASPVSSGPPTTPEDRTRPLDPEGPHA